MSEKNHSNGEVKENDANYEGGDYQQNQSGTSNPIAGLDMNYSGSPEKDLTQGNRIRIEPPKNYIQGQNPQNNTPNRPDYTNPNYQANYNQSQMNNYRGADRMNYPRNYTGDSRMNYPGNYTGDGRTNYPGNYTADARMNYPGNYAGDGRMNYPGNYTGDGRTNYSGNYAGDDVMNYPANYRVDGRTNYPVNHKGEDDYYYDCPHPYYHHDYDCDFYEGGRPYYSGYRTPYRRARYGAGYPNMQGCDPYYNQGMMPNSWWHPNMIRDFINRPRVNNFLRGVGIATVGLILAPSVTRTLRPIVVKAVQGAMSASDEVKSIFVDAKEDMEDIFAEAKWEGSRDEGLHHDEDERLNK